MNYHYVANGQQTGPVSEEQLATMHANGVITGETLVWCEGMPQWAPYSTITKGAGTAASVPMDPAGGSKCSICHGTFPPDQTIQYGTMAVCAGCKPRFLQGLREGAITGGLEFATVGARFGAKFIDNILLYVVNLALGVAAGTSNDPQAAIIMTAVGMVLGVAYQVILLGWRGQTLGKMATGVKVVNPDGSKIGYGKALGRSLAEILSGCLLSIGYIIALWDDEKRTLHDRIAGTRVIKVKKKS